ncbi:hypothetical protein GJ26_18970, partial [Vibrio cholerae]
NSNVKIPAGSGLTGDRIRLSGEGEAGEMGAPAGDLTQMSKSQRVVDLPAIAFVFPVKVKREKWARQQG